MFWKRRNKIDFNVMSQILPTSKFDLKMQCIAIAKGNVEEAEKLYNFLAGDIDIPDVTIPPLTKTQQFKEAAGSLFGWLKENQGDLVKAYNFIQSVRHGTPVSEAVSGVAQAATDLPPIPPTPPIQ